MKRRIFAAVELSEALRNEILSWQKEWRNLSVRWLQGKNLHITVAPPWYVDKNELENIKRKFKKATGCIKPFEIRFEAITYGPNPLLPRLIWATGKTPEEIINLKNCLETILGITPGKRPLLLHLTLARFRPEDFRSFSEQKLNEKIDWRDRINSCVLMESRLSRDGADYEILDTIK